MAKLLPCPACKKKISVQAESCPKCGHVMTDEEREKAIKTNRHANIFAAVVMIVITLFVVGTCMGPDEVKTASEQSPATEIAQPETTNTPETGDLQVQLKINVDATNAKPYVTVTSNLPDGMSLSAKIYAMDNKLMGGDKAILSAGSASFGPFSRQGEDYPNGEYKLSISSGMWRFQSDAIQKAIEGRKITGECINSDGWVDCEGNFTIENSSYVPPVIVPEHAELAEDFGYALQAAMICDNLKMRPDTIGKIEQSVGGKITGPQSPYNKNYGQGIDQAFADENNGLCQKAWKQYGCQGSKVARLIQENPFTLSNPKLCEY